ncbi:hypothetical protein MPTK1_5g22150 [Marchantia polymorpha subsp. ruderalis]|uniref:BLOC-1-related complex subunit 5 n=2 Tax=Marchantia polymorpha TaxID=3197 RepID=A0AAF6BL10_MARPO|nr:hypothetical protein MARPO_0166s0009 [Marchantia polymorpha]BBN12694.1 hypothetical protein Mp_5g22150 [Marchantia polymorpha subsp. ruderalis]|eukprot:PTQ28351.1 hypothetical protein MARPO_0166s0009 [Marchantia polymorpha]
MGSALSSTDYEEDDTKGRNESVDPVLEKLRDLHVVTPILKTPTGDSSLTDILLRRTPSQSTSEALDPTTTAKLFAVYQEWQRVTAANIAKNQEELGHKIIGVEELSLKLLQRLMYAGRVMESSAAHLKSVHALQVEVTDMKRTLTETISNYEKLCQKVETMGLHKRNIKPMSISSQSQFGSQDVRAKTLSLPQLTTETSSEQI